MSLILNKMVPDNMLTPAQARLILHLSQDATSNNVRRAFRLGVLKTHPNKGGTASNFQKVKNARNLLLTHLLHGHGPAKPTKKRSRSPVKRSPPKRSPHKRSPPKYSPPMWSPVMKMFSTSSATCVPSTLKKYRQRPSPPYPAQGCPYMTKTGNDGQQYRSTPNVNMVFSWKKV